MARIRQLTLRYARARLGRFGDEDVAQDVAQEVCMAVHTALPDYDERGLPFEAFLYAIAARKVADSQLADARAGGRCRGSGRLRPRRGSGADGRGP